MPIYSYKCRSCGKSFDISQSYNDDPVRDCPYCNAKGSVKKVYEDVPVIFHGSGYYCTDHPSSSCADCPHSNK